MGIVFVLFAYAIVLSIGAAIASAVLGGLTWRALRHVTSGKKRAMTFALGLPPACVAFLGIWFVGYAVINDIIFDRDPGLGDNWYTPLPNGYSIDFIDVTTQGTIYNTKAHSNPNPHVEEDTVRGVRRVQLDGKIIAGTYDSDYFGNYERETEENHYFLIDAAKSSKIEYADLGALNVELKRRGLTSHLATIWDVFLTYRNTWFDYAAGIFALSVPTIGLVLLILFVLRLRRQHPLTSKTA